MGRILVVAVAALGAASSAHAQDAPPTRDWPSTRFRGATPVGPPCSCRAPTGPVEVGEETCLSTPAGGLRARCVLVLNNTSWAVSTLTCGSVAMAAP